MTINEKHSLRKKTAILYLIDNGEYSLGYALIKVEELYDAGKLTDSDYEELADYIEELLNKVEITPEVIADDAENTTDSSETTVENDEIEESNEETTNEEE